MTNRFKDAIQSQNAVNPTALANTLVKWSKEIIAAGGGTDAVRNDPACRLLVYQLAYLMGVADEFDYSALTNQCEKLAETP